MRKINTQCPKCHHHILGTLKHSGSRFRCPNCGHIFKIEDEPKNNDEIQKNVFVPSSESQQADYIDREDEPTLREIRIDHPSPLAVEFKTKSVKNRRYMQTAVSILAVWVWFLKWFSIINVVILCIGF